MRREQHMGPRQANRDSGSVLNAGANVGEPSRVGIGKCHVGGMTRRSRLDGAVAGDERE